MKELNVVIPVYNEQDAVLKLLDEWTDMLDSEKIEYEINIYNDGSTDNTAGILEKYIHPRVTVHNKKNSGHGPTILKGYRENTAEWVFQTDSDREISASHFSEFWKKRQNYDFIIGRRQNRHSPFARLILSVVSRVMVQLLTAGRIHDVNCPYRLMRASAFRKIYLTIPVCSFAPNILICAAAGVLKLSVCQIPVNFSFRKTGEVSIKKWKLLKVACISFIQLLKYRLQFFQ